MPEKPRIYTPEDQYRIITDATSQEAYEKFVNGNFDAQHEYLSATTNECPDASYLPYIWQLKTLNAKLAKNHGFELMNRQIIRHQEKGWKKSPSHPWHQMALARYLAKVNLDSLPYKQAWHDSLLRSSRDKPYAPGCWGIFIGVQRGELKFTEAHDLPQVRVSARKLYERSTGILLPTPELYRDLAGINFDGDKAESFTPDEFNKLVYPLFAGVMRRYFSPK